MVEKLLQTLLDAAAVGSLYALIALGYTMVYGVLKFINFAHSDVFVLGAWVSFSAALAAGWTLSGEPGPVAGWVYALPVAVGVWAGLAWLVERAVRPRLSAAWRRRIPATSAAPALSLGAAWGGLILALVHLARPVQELSPPLAAGLILVIAMLTCGLVGFGLERMAYKPLRAAPRLNVLITAIGVSLLLQNLGQLDWMFGTRPQRMPELLPDSLWQKSAGAPPAAAPAGGGMLVRVRPVDMVSAATSIVLMVALDRLVFATRLGRAMRAVSYNTTTASLMGISVDRVISFTFVLGTMLAAAAGFLYVQKYPGLNQPASPGWVLLGLKAFVAAVVGGIGNVRGAMLGGLLIGLLEQLTKAYVSTSLADVYVFALLIVVLLVRPTGILGSVVREKV